MLLMPDLLAYWLTGEVGAERTNASTTGLLDVRSGDVGHRTRRAAGPPLGDPAADPRPGLGRRAGAAVRVRADWRGVPVVAVGSHDTASAVVGVPAGDESFAYISSGTWSLVGVELDAPVLTEEARLANFTNEGGVDGTIRFLRNVMGLWVLSECVA